MELLDYWRVARRSWVVLVASTLVGLSLAAAYSLTQPTVSSDTASAYVVAGTSESTGDALAGSALAKEKAEIYLPLVTSQQVATRIAEDLQVVTQEGDEVQVQFGDLARWVRDREIPLELSPSSNL